MSKFAAKLIFCVTMVSVYPSMACADQNDPRLDQLFADLQTPLSTTVVEETEAKIWAYWTSFPDDESVENTMTKATQLMQAGRLQLAERILSRIIDREPDFSEAWNKRATVRFMIGNHDGSVNDIAKVLQLEPRHFGALSGLGMIHMRAGNWESALKSYEAAFAIHPYLSNIETLIDDLTQRLKGQAS
jgi:tetratricopeptide (TPR) repeat protein